MSPLIFIAQAAILIQCRRRMRLTAQNGFIETQAAKRRFAAAFARERHTRLLQAIGVAPVLLLALLAGGRVVAAGEVFEVSNGRLGIGIGQAHGDLVRLTDARTHQNFAAAAASGAGLWELTLSGPEKLLSPADAKSFHSQSISGKEPALRLTWEQFGVLAAPALRVEVLVRLERGQPMSRWELALSGLGGLGVGQVRFPRVVNIPRQENERLAVPVWMGEQLSEPRKFFAGDGKGAQRQQWAYPGILSMQCLAFYRQDGPGLYVACDDTAVFNKAFAFFGAADGKLGCEVVHLPEGLPPEVCRPGVRPSSGAAIPDSPFSRGSSNASVPANVAAPGDGRTPPKSPASSAGSDAWRLPYSVRLGTFEGDWLTAAERYRAWATNQVWAKQSRLARGQVPDWARDTALWVWNRGRSPGVLEPAVVLREKLGLPVSVFWHWWHGCAYDTGFPEYFPPREGTERFTNALAAAQAKGIHALVYMNQRLWGTTTRSWANEGAERFAVKGADGKVHPEIYNTYSRLPCAPMCMGTEFWQQKYAGLATRAVHELGVDGIYMDQACTSLPCYDPHHGHPLGGGVYWMRGFRALESDIRSRCAAHGEPVVLAGEGCSEAWLPYLDLMLSLQVSRERYMAASGWETIPFFHAVYHPYAVFYGNYSSLTMPPYDELWPAEFAPAEPLKLLDRKFSRQFCLEQARAFVWGQQPAIANFLPVELTERAEEVDFVMRIARLRSRAAKYLLHGTFLRPPQVHGPSATLDFSRLWVYGGRQGGLTEYQKTSPLVLAAAWGARDKNIAVAFASIASEPIRVSFDLPDGGYGLALDSAVYQMDEKGRRRIGTLRRLGSSIKLELPARAACILELVPPRNTADSRRGAEALSRR